MDVVEKLRLWGAAHGAARSAQRQAEEQGSPERRSEAQRLRERADRLHGEIYRELGGTRRERPGRNA